MSGTIEEKKLNIETLDDYDYKLNELKNKLKQYKLLKNTLNIAFFGSLITFFYTHYTANDKDYISASLFTIILLSKLYLENKIEDKEDEYERTQIMIRSLKKM